MRIPLTCLGFLLLMNASAFAQRVSRPNSGRPGSGAGNSSFAVLAYYSGDATTIDKYDVSQLTHIIYSFCHLKGNQLFVGDGEPVIRKLVSLKKKQPGLKVLLSLGGWGGCKTCSDVFSTKGGRDSFAVSVKEWIDKLGTDGIDLDWEYPAYEGPPGHPWKDEDRSHFTELVKSLRKTLGKHKEISFAAGGFNKCLQVSIDWKVVMPLVDRVNIMSYDLVNGYSTVSGHHTALYSTPQLNESADNAVRYLQGLGIPLNKMVIGAAFYARIFGGADSVNNGLYRPATFKSSVAYRSFDEHLTAGNGFTFHRDETAKAPFAYDAREKLLATFDDSLSVDAKTKFALDKRLNGIMFWELTLDKPTGGLLQAITNARR